MSRNIALSLAAALGLAALAACGPDRELPQAGAATLARSAWLGSAEGWGLLGLPRAGGPLTYRGAGILESPTWASSDMEPILGAWPGVRTIWVQLTDSLIARFDYSTGHLLTYDEPKGAIRTAAALEDGGGLVIGRDEGTVELIGGPERWNFDLNGRLSALRPAGDGMVVAVVESDGGIEVVALKPPAEEPLARRAVDGVRDLVVTAWGEQLYYLPPPSAGPVVRGLTLPEMEPLDELTLPEPGRAIGATPSSHRLYVAGSQTLYVFNRLSGTRLRDVDVAGPVEAMRFGVNGTNLLARLENADRVVVLQVGVDSLLGELPSEWGSTLPVALPGGRVVARLGSEIVLYELPRLNELARSTIEKPHVWMPVEWHPPRPRVELVRRSVRQVDRPPPEALIETSEEGDESEAAEETVPDGVAPPGYYAVVLAARAYPGVDDLVAWLRSVGYSAVRDRHQDVMGVIWYRAMVGPYPNRARAEEAAHSLSARYGYKPWILSVEESDEEAAGAVEATVDSVSSGMPPQEDGGGASEGAEDGDDDGG